MSQNKPFGVTLNFVIIRHKKTQQIWATAHLPNDQDNEVNIYTDQDYYHSNMQEFVDNFVLCKNARYFVDTDNFVVEAEQRIITFE